MNKLVERFGSAVKGVLRGFDRLIFKGWIQPLSYPQGAMDFLRWRGVLNRDYRKWMQEQTKLLVDAVDQYASEHGLGGVSHLNSWRVDKEALSRRQQTRLGIKSGLVGAWSCLEAGRSFRARYSETKGYPQLRTYWPQCKHVYLYMDHPDYGWMHIRIQTWFPYDIQVALNGRQWLRRQLDRAGIGYLQRRNKFLHIDDYAAAQRLLSQQVRQEWPRLLNRVARHAFPTMAKTLAGHLRYYWTLWQSEWASDLIMDRPSNLCGLVEALLRHALMSGTSTRVLRYLGRPLTRSGRPDGRCSDEVRSRVLQFYEGLRVRHWVGTNSVKIYNQYNVLRVETTMNNPEMFRVHRRAQNTRSDAPKRLMPLRKGVCDTPLRARVCEEINQRFMEGVANFTHTTALGELLTRYDSPRRRAHRRVRALDVCGKDRLLLECISDPAFAVSGFTNAMLRERLRETRWASGRTHKQLCARVTRHLRLLRDHGLIRKLPARNRYLLSRNGAKLTTALAAALAASTERLMECAA